MDSALGLWHRKQVLQHDFQRKRVPLSAVKHLQVGYGVRAHPGGNPGAN